MARKAPTKTKTVSISEEVHNLLADYCKLRGIKVGHFVSLIVEQYIKQKTTIQVMARKAPTKTKTVNISEEVHNLLADYCKLRGIKVGHFVSLIVEQYIKQKP